MGTAVGGAIRRASRREARALRRIGLGLALNLVLAFAWLLVDPLEYTSRTQIPVIVVYFVTFVLADPVTTNMLGDQAAARSGRSTGFVDGLAIVIARNVTLMMGLGVPLVAATVTLVVLTGHRPMVPAAASSVVLQLLVWLGICSVLAALFPVVTAGPRRWWSERRKIRVTGWRVFGATVPYVLLWLLVPAEGQRRRLPGLGAVHSRTPGAHPISQTHQAIGAILTGVTVWIVCVAIGAVVVRIRNWRPRA